MHCMVLPSVDTLVRFDVGRTQRETGFIAGRLSYQLDIQDRTGRSDHSRQGLVKHVNCSHRSRADIASPAGSRGVADGRSGSLDHRTLENRCFDPPRFENEVAKIRCFSDLYGILG